MKIATPPSAAEIPIYLGAEGPEERRAGRRDRRRLEHDLLLAQHERLLQPPPSPKARPARARHIADTFDVVGGPMWIIIDDDTERTADLLRPSLALYIGGMGGIRHRRRLGRVSAQPVGDEDLSDPEVILKDLPERERAEFLRQYHEAVDAAHDPAGYRRLRNLLHAWGLTVIATSQDGYCENWERYQRGIARPTPAKEAIRAAPRRLRPPERRRGDVPDRVTVSDRVLGQLGGFPARAFDALIAIMATVVEYPDDRCGHHRRPLRAAR